MTTTISNIHQLKELKMKHLVKTTTYFFDAHGCAEEGSTKLKISDDECYQGLDPSEEYDDDLNIVSEDEDDDNYAKDGYHCKRRYVHIKPLTDEEVDATQKTIDDYTALINGFNVEDD